MSKLYVVCYDDSAASQRALDFAIEDAKGTGATLLIVHVLEWSPYSFLTPTELEERHARRAEELERARTALIDPIMSKIKGAGVEARSTIRYGHVVDSICAIAEEEKAEQIYVGRTGNQSMATRVFGSVASSLAQAAPVACTIVP